MRALFCLVAVVAIALDGNAADVSPVMDDVLAGVPGAVSTLSGSIVLPNATRATWVDDHRILVAADDHTLALRDVRTRQTLSLPIPAPATKLPASWHWSVSPDGRWAFVTRSDAVSRRYPHAPPPDVAAEARTLAWSGFVDLAAASAIPYEGVAMGWQGNRSLVALSEKGGPLLLVDPNDPSHARWLFDDAGTISAISVDGRHAFAYSSSDRGPAYRLLDLVEGSVRRLDIDAHCAVRAAFSPDARWLVTATIDCRDTTSGTAEARSLVDGRVVYRARLPKLGSMSALTPIAGAVPRFAILSSAGASTRLIVLSLRETLIAEEIAAPPMARLGDLAASPRAAALYWVSEAGGIVRYDVDQRQLVLAPSLDSANNATFVASTRPTWFFYSHLPSASYSVYWPSKKDGSQPDPRCRISGVCLAEGIAAITGESGIADFARGARLLEDACNLHDANACYALAQAFARTTPHLASTAWLFRKACLTGITPACNTSDMTPQVAPTAAAPPIVTMITMGCSAVCGLRSDRSVVCLGGEPVPPVEFESIAAGGSHVCGLRPGGAVVCWGAGGKPPTNEATTSEYGQSRPPKESFSMLTAGGRHTCGLLLDGTARCWGSNEHGQATPPASARFRTLSAGQEHTCGVRDDNRVVCWGAGTTNAGTRKSWESGQSKPPAESFLTVSAGSLHTCGITKTHEIRCWGSNRDWNGKLDGKATPPRGSFANVVAANTHSSALKLDGSVKCWGANDDRQTDAPPGRFVQVDRGCQSACALDDRGEAKCWGNARGVALWGPRTSR